MTTSTAQVHPNIAFIKYCKNTLRLPMNGSISMNLAGLTSCITVSFQSSLAFDELITNRREVTSPRAGCLYSRYHPRSPRLWRKRWQDNLRSIKFMVL